MEEEQAQVTMTLAQLFAQQLNLRPLHPALVVGKGDVVLSFEALALRVDRLASALESRGISAGDRVAVCLPNSVAFVESILALSQRDAIAVPVDTSFGVQEAEVLLEDSGACAVLFDAKTQETFAARGGEPLGLEDEIFFARCEGHPAGEDLEDVVMFKYTSGSTGIPKGVVLTASEMQQEGRNVVSTLRLDHEDRILTVIPLYHSYGFDFCMMPMLTCGATLVLLDTFHARTILRTLQEQRVTVFPAVPFMFDLLTRIQSDAPPELSSIRYCISAAAPLSARTVRRFYDTYGIVISQNYGSSEAGAITLESRRKPGVASTCLGKPLHNVTVKILDEEGQAVAVGETGEVVVGGQQVSSRGYYRDPGLSALSFRDGFCYTGDIGWLDSTGALFLSGRKKNVINVAGKKVIPQEVQAVIEQLPGVLEVVVVGVEDEAVGEICKACIVADREIPIEELVAFCQDRLASYKIPQRWSFWDSLPRNPVGKIEIERLKG